MSYKISKFNIDDRVKFKFGGVGAWMTGTVVGHITTNFFLDIILLDNPIVNPTTGQIITRTMLVNPDILRPE
jgi:hypothetical protein